MLDAGRNLRCQLPAWQEGVVTTQWSRGEQGWTCQAGPIASEIGRWEMIYRAMVTGLADYVGKNGFPGVLIGMSGGIDSALTAAVATDALGAERVHCVMMPSRYTSRESLEDAAACSGLLSLPPRRSPGHADRRCPQPPPIQPARGPAVALQASVPQEPTH